MFGQCQPERHNLFVAGETGHWKVTSMIDEITVHLATQVNHFVVLKIDTHRAKCWQGSQKPRSGHATQKLVAGASGRSQEIVVPSCGTDHARLVNTLSVIVNKTYWAAFSTGRHLSFEPFIPGRRSRLEQSVEPCRYPHGKSVCSWHRAAVDWRERRGCCLA